MVFNATFNNISVISCIPVFFLLVEKTEKNTDLSQVTDTLGSILKVVSSTPRHGLMRNKILIIALIFLSVYLAHTCSFSLGEFKCQCQHYFT